MTTSGLLGSGGVILLESPLLCPRRHRTNGIVFRLRHRQVDKVVNEPSHEADEVREVLA